MSRAKQLHSIILRLSGSRSHLFKQQRHRLASTTTPTVLSPASEAVDQKTAKEDADNDAIRNLNSLEKVKPGPGSLIHELDTATKTPPWQSEAVRHQLPLRLKAYHTELQEGKQEFAHSEASIGPSLPFLHDALHTVFQEEIAVSGSAGSASGLEGGVSSQDEEDVNTIHPGILSAHPLLLQQDNQTGTTTEQQQSTESREVDIREAVAAVCTSLAPLIPLGMSQWVAIAEEIRSTLNNNTATTLMPTRAQDVVLFLLEACHLSEHEVLKLISSDPWILGVDTSVKSASTAVLELLSKVLEMEPRQVASLIASHPRVLQADVDGHLLPLAAYLEDLGLTGRQVAEFFLHYPRATDSVSYHDLTSSVAFWVGKGLKRTEVVKLLIGVPQVIGMSQQLVQLKVDWLIDNVGFTIHDFVLLPRSLSQPLASVVGPRVAYAKHLGFAVQSPTDYHKRLGSDGGLQRNILAINALVIGESRYLKSVRSDGESYERFANEWRRNEFSTWLTKRNNSTLHQYQTLDWLESADVALIKRKHAVGAARRQEAWAQQQDREKEWRKEWRVWKVEQRSKEKMQELQAKAAKRHAEKLMYNAQLESALEARMQAHKRMLEEALQLSSTGALSTSTDADEQAEEEMCQRVPNCSKSPGHVGKCKTGRTKPGNTSSDSEEESTDPCDKHPLCKRTLGHKGLCDVEPGSEKVLIGIDLNEPSERVKECAKNIVALLENAPDFHYRSADIATWARQQGYSPSCVKLAKSLLVAREIAEVCLQDTPHHKFIGDKVWRLRIPELGRTREADELINPSIVWSAAKSILDQLRAAPDGVLSSKDLEALAMTTYAKSVYKRAVMLLYEEGRAVRQSRYTTGNRGFAGEVMLLNVVDLVGEYNVDI